MARTFHFECDGCGEERTEKKNSVPPGFADVSVKISGLSMPFSGVPDPAEKTFLLCSSCQHRIVASCNPNGWPRAAQAEAYDAAK